jgi:AraC-like DNA-binding protein
VRSEIPIYDINNFREYKTQGLVASRFGHYSKTHAHLHSPHRHSFYHLVFFTQGSGHHHIDFKQFDVKPTSMYFMVPGQVHSWSFQSEPDGYIINFSKDYFNAFLSNTAYFQNFSIFSGIADQQVITVNEDTSDALIASFEEILGEGAITGLLRDDLVRTLLLQIFIKAERASGHKIEVTANSYNHTIFRNFQKLIAEHYTTLKLPKEYAALLYITPNHLNALCKDIMGASAGELIREQVILEAKRLLINLDLSVAEIADKLNFNDHSYFIKFFKKQEGLTPEKFRKLNILQHGK